jgi:hypothetical protein
MIDIRTPFVTLILMTSFVCATQASADSGVVQSADQKANQSADQSTTNATAGSGVNPEARILQVEDSTTQRVQADGRGAHLGREMCGFKSAGIARYKAALKRSLGNPANFDSAWEYGWSRADSTLLEYQTLRTSDPQDYELRVRRMCATLRRIGELVENPPAKPASAQQ